jgi:phosphoglycolate phosphatase-like HAD superfamily hydrolase
VAPSLEAIFWDVDGTLAETELDGHRVAYNQALTESGLPWRWDRARYLDDLGLAGGRERMARFLTDLEGSPPSGLLLDTLVAAKKRHYAELMRNGIEPWPAAWQRWPGPSAAGSAATT